MTVAKEAMINRFLSLPHFTVAATLLA